jgi:hypothetical protein
MLRAALFALAVSAPEAPAAAPPRADTVVAADGSGQWKSLAAAVAAAPAGARDRRWVIRVKPGTYRESIHVRRAQSFLVLAGEDAATTIVAGEATVEGGRLHRARHRVRRARPGVDRSFARPEPAPPAARAVSSGRTAGCGRTRARRTSSPRDAARRDRVPLCRTRDVGRPSTARAGGERLALDLCVPAGPGPYPAALLVHGGGWSSGDRTQAAQALRAPLVSSGIAWIAVDYRLAPRHGIRPRWRTCGRRCSG